MFQGEHYLFTVSHFVTLKNPLKDHMTSQL